MSKKKEYAEMSIAKQKVNACSSMNLKSLNLGKSSRNQWLLKSDKKRFYNSSYYNKSIYSPPK